MLWLAIEMHGNHWEIDNHGHKSYCHVECKGDLRVFEAALETKLIYTPYSVCIRQSIGELRATED